MLVVAIANEEAGFGLMQAAKVTRAGMKPVFKSFDSSMGLDYCFLTEKLPFHMTASAWTANALAKKTRELVSKTYVVPDDLPPIGEFDATSPVELSYSEFTVRPSGKPIIELNLAGRAVSEILSNPDALNLSKKLKLSRTQTTKLVLHPLFEMLNTDESWVRESRSTAELADEFLAAAKTEARVEPSPSRASVLDSPDPWDEVEPSEEVDELAELDKELDALDDELGDLASVSKHMNGNNWGIL
ncbi:hypothetical protein JCM19235_1373 [Vibrio maritimus]|uniref:Uncharacterized protein n=1 Tax=Vibrio maritimus TaxID=990268 RepID=A0A090SUR6_9VIBR|nr:hypothetical protein JCM19235_1373 [Vibrio maritimus]